MKILVPVKRVMDHTIKLRIRPDGSDVDMTNVRMVMNPFDEVAVEQAVRMKENGTADEVVAVTIGGAKAVDVLYTALAMGADRAVHIRTEAVVETLEVAKILSVVVRDEQPDLVITGKQATDNDANQVGQMLAGLLDWGQATFVSALEVLSDNTIRVAREIDGGKEILEMDLPCLITADLSMVTPRYAALPAILQARKKPVETVELHEMGMDWHTRIEVLSVEEPPKRERAAMVGSVDELIDKLRNEAGVLS